MYAWETEQVLLPRALQSFDAIIESSEGARFYAHKCMIFRVCQKFDRCVKGTPILSSTLTQIKSKLTTRALYLLIWLAYPHHVRTHNFAPPMESRDDVEALVTVACDLDVKAGLPYVRRALHSRSLQAGDSTWAYAIGYRCRLPDVCRIAAYDTLKARFLDSAESCQAALQSVDGCAVSALYAYREQCQERVLLYVFPKDRTRYVCEMALHNGVCASSDSLGEPSVRPYWEFFADSVLHLLVAMPHPSTVRNGSVVATSFEKANRCEDCAVHASRFFEHNVKTLEEDVEKAIREVKLSLPFPERDYEREINSVGSLPVSGWSPSLCPFSEIEGF